MRLLRWWLVLAAMAVAVKAATPAFQSFDTNDFLITPSLAQPQKIHALRSDTTNSFTNVTIINQGGVIINTNVFVTNVNTTIVNTNVTQEFNFTTNIIDNSVVNITNTVINITNTVININGNTNGVGSLNPTIGRLPYKQDTNSFGDSSMYFIDTNTTGTATLEVTDLANGGVVISLPSGIVTNVVNGTGALTNDGAGNLGWADISGANLWTNNAGILEPVDLALQPMIQNGLAVGTNTLAFWGSNLTNGEVIVSTSNPDLGDPDSKVIDLSVLNSAVVGTRFNLQLHTNYTRMQNWNKAIPAGTLNMLEWTIDTNEAYLDLQIAGAIRTALRPNTSTSTVPFQVDSALPRYGAAAPIMTFGNYGTNMLSVNWDGGLIFGPGTTNVLYREAGSGNLAYWNTGTDPKLILYNGSTNGVELEAQGATGFLSVAGLSTTIGLRAGVDQVVMTGGAFYPVIDLGESSGSQDHAWKDLWVSNTFVRGYTSAATNYSWLKLHHTGTNGVGSGIVFESQANGAGGNPRPFVFTNAPVQLPWFTSLQKTNLAEVANGMLIYQTDNTPGIRAYVNGAWVILQTAADP